MPSVTRYRGVRARRRALPALIVTLSAASLSRNAVSAGEFRSAWPPGLERTWVGPEYYANRLQDWRVRDGRLECVEASLERPVRVLHLLTASVDDKPGKLTMSVRTGPIEPDRERNDESWAGFLIGAGGEQVDYRLTALVHHRPAADGGLLAIIDGKGRAAFRDNETNSAAQEVWSLVGALNPGELDEIPASSQVVPTLGTRMPDDVELRLELAPTGGGYKLTLTAYDPADGKLVSQATLERVDPRLVDGGLGLVSHRGPPGGKLGHWFHDWRISGSKLMRHDERAFGPVLCTQYTLSRGTLKLTAQMPPLGKLDTHVAALQVQADDGHWRTVGESRLDEPSYTITFHVEDWDATRDRPFRIVYKLKTGRDSAETRIWPGTIRREPTHRDQFVLAAFTGTRHFTGGLAWNRNGVWFPHNDLVAAVGHHDPDLLFFSGDQIYEADLTGAQRSPLDQAVLDYLDKWYRWCWTFRDLARDRPCICIPDDHDVYHGNLWGAGGRSTNRMDEGGYIMPPEFVNMVERTQTSHLPDPYDPTPVEQGIGVYYTSVEYAGLSFAVLEDRKFKTGPVSVIPPGKIVTGWFADPEFDPVTQADVPGAVLLGERQLKFLRDWASDWSGGTWMKVALSQTIFANVATIPADATNDGALPGLPIPLPGEYPSGYKLATDADSNGWPQTGRNRALRELRRGFALHIAGDQHLGSFVHYGVEEWDDAGYGFCVPAIGNIWPRRWFPSEPGRNPRADLPPYTGQYRDGFGNHINVYAVSNPMVVGRQPARLYNRATGYGVVRFNRKTRDIVVECWPRWEDPSRPDAAQYPGWPVTINQLDNYGRKATAHLPTIDVSGMTDPVIRVIDQQSGELVYALRIRGRSFRPKVFHPGMYTLDIGEPGTAGWRTITDLTAPAPEGAVLQVEF